MSTPDVPGAALRVEALRFAETLTRTVQTAFGPDVPGFTATAVAAPEAARFRVGQRDAAGMTLQVGGVPLLRLTVEYRCVWDHREDFLAVEKSSVQVLAATVREPLFQYDYLRQPQSVPAAHLQVYGHRDALTYALTLAGRGSPRGRRRSDAATGGERVPRMGDLHFPLGGARYRPCLEDVLQMLANELGVDVQPGAREALAASRQEWRRNQLGAAVRDSPETAAATLRGLGYEVEPPASGPLPERVDKLRAL